MMDESLAEKLEQLQKEYAKKKRKLKKCQRAASAKAHVKKKLLEHNMPQDSETDDSFIKDQDRSNAEHESSINSHGDQTIKIQPVVETTSVLNEKGEADSCSENATDYSKSKHKLQDDSLQNSNYLITRSGESSPQSKNVGSNCSVKNNTDKSSNRLAKYMKKKNVFKIKSKEPNDMEIDACNKTCSGENLPNDKRHYNRQENGEIKDSNDLLGECNKVLSAYEFHRHLEPDCNQPNIFEVRRQSVDTNKNNKIKDKMSQDNHQVEADVGMCNEKLDSNTNNETTQTTSKSICDKENNKIIGISHIDKALSMEGSDKSSICSEDLFDSHLSGTDFRTIKKGRRKSAAGSRRKRQSARLAELSSQDNSSASPQSDIQENSPVYLDCTLKKMKKKVIISSMFQCLIDEGKRKSNEDFIIPCEYKKNSQEKCEKELEETVKSVQDLKTDVDSLTCSQGLNKTDTIEICHKEVKIQNDSNCFNFMPADKEDEGNQSPVLFESQNFTNDQPVINSHENLENIACAYEMDISEDFADKDPLEIEESNDADIENDLADYASGTTKKNSYANEIHLDQIASFQIPESDTLLGLDAITVLDEEGGKSVYVACLCTTALRLYHYDHETWHCIRTSKHTTVLRKKCVFSLHSWSGIQDVHLVMVLSRSDGTVLTHYTLTDTDIKHTQIDHVDTKGVCSCTLTRGQFVVARWTGSKTELTKYTMDILTGHWIHTDLESCVNRIVSMATVKQKPMAVAGFSNQGVLHIWNHECGFLLSTIDLSDVCPRDFSCPVIYHEEGFLFLPLLNKKKGSEAGSIVVVNPQMGTSETLVSLQAKDKNWTGCSKAFLLKDDLLVTKETNGRCSVLDLYTGHPLATLDDANITSLSCVDNFLFLAHKQCIHVFKS